VWFLSGIVVGTGADRIAMLEMDETVGIGYRQGLLSVMTQQLLTMATVFD